MCSHPLTKSVILSQKTQLIEFLATFCCDFFICRITCERVATHCDFLRALVTRQFSKKSHHHRKQKIARVAAALLLGDSRYIGKKPVKNCLNARAKMTSDKFDDERLLARKTNENKTKNG